MVQLDRWLALPPTLLAHILASTSSVHAQAREQELEWPYNLPPHVKYYPEHESLVKRNVEARQKLSQQQTPVGMRKMSGDPNEMFFLDYWEFEGVREELGIYENASMSMPVDLTAPLQLHAKGRSSRFVPIPMIPRFLGRSLFDKRDFECPAGSYACTDIGRSDSCCDQGSTCQLVQDVGLGDVGCCPGTQVCGGSVSNCPAGGYTDCPQNPGGGCCLPGYACYQEGCVATSTAVVVVTPTPSPTTSSTSTPPPPITSTVDTTTVLVPVPSSDAPTPSPSTTTITETPAPTTTSTPPNTLACSSGFRSCPAAMGGGCCPSDRACGSDICPELTSTGSFTAPARPTSDSSGPTITSTSTTSLTSIPGASCPTGFYACSAFYVGGCCRVDRNCESTSCPAGGSITVADGSTITAVAPTGSGISSAQTLLTGSCASGWSSCAADVGGGCCPVGYACGSVCRATGTGGQGSEVGRAAPVGSGGEGGKGRLEGSYLALVVGVLGALVLFG